MARLGTDQARPSEEIRICKKGLSNKINTKRSSLFFFSSIVGAFESPFYIKEIPYLSISLSLYIYNRIEKESNRIEKEERKKDYLHCV